MQGLRLEFVLSRKLKEKAKKQAKFAGITLSEYIRDLIVKDTKKKG